ncbi:hypothetical protein ACU686_31135 [Yinghuangia aomiensis]
MHVLVLNSGTAGSDNDTSTTAALVLFAGFGGLAVLFWAYFRFVPEPGTTPAFAGAPGMTGMTGMTGGPAAYGATGPYAVPQQPPAGSYGPRLRRRRGRPRSPRRPAGDTRHPSAAARAADADAGAGLHRLGTPGRPAAADRLADSPAAVAPAVRAAARGSPDAAYRTCHPGGPAPAAERARRLRHRPASTGESGHRRRLTRSTARAALRSTGQPSAGHRDLPSRCPELLPPRPGTGRGITASV